MVNFESFSYFGYQKQLRIDLTYRINMRPAQGAGTDDAKAMDYRCQVDGYANTSKRRVEQPGDKTLATHQRELVCAKLSAGLKLIRESSIAPAQHISGVQISFRCLTKVGATSKFWLKLTDVKRHCRKVGNLSTT